MWAFNESGYIGAIELCVLDGNEQRRMLQTVNTYILQCFISNYVDLFLKSQLSFLKINIEIITLCHYRWINLK